MGKLAEHRSEKSSPSVAIQNQRMFRALADSPADADLFVGVLTGAVPLRSFMSPGYLIRLVGVGGFMKLAMSR